MSYQNADSLLDPASVADLLDDCNVRILDGSSHLAATGRDARAE